MLEYMSKYPKTASHIDVTAMLVAAYGFQLPHVSEWIIARWPVAAERYINERRYRSR